MAGIRIDPSDAAPIWSQIEENVRRLVASGALAPDVAVPSVRDLASELRVNPATVARAYQRLADAGVLTVRRGEGTYVAHDPPELPRPERTRLLRQAAVRFASLAVTLGASAEDAAAALQFAWRDLKREKAGRA